MVHRADVVEDKYFPEGIVEHPSTATKVRRYAGQAVFAVIAMAFVGYFSSNPVYRLVPENSSQIKVSLAHSGQRIDPCRERTPEELAALPPNMRAKMICGRERHLVTLEIDVNGETVYQETKGPKGLSGDGPAVFYHKIVVPSGRNTFSVRLRDGGQEEGFNHIRDMEIDLEPYRNYVVTFQHEMGGFQFH